MYIVGNGVILFSVWCLFKGIALNILSVVRIETLAGGFFDHLSYREVHSTVGINLAFDFVFRMIIGFHAREEGKGKRQKSYYIVLALFLILAYFVKIAGRVVDIYNHEGELIDQFFLTVIDVTSVSILMNLVFAVIKSRKLARLLGQR